MTYSSPIGTCPNCGRPLPAHPPSAQCPQCGLPQIGQLFAQLQWVEGELRRLHHQRETLLDHRRALLDAWRAGAAPGAKAAGPVPAPPHPGGSRWPAAAPVQRPEASPRTARNVLLALGGVLLTVAALAFTLLSWGSMGIGGRAAVLATVTLVATGLPAVLLRRALNATAEAVAGVGLVLLLLDAYALRQVSLHDTDALRYTAGAVAVIAALWAAYGLLLRPTGTAGPRLRVPVPAAVALGQLPVPLWAASAGAGTQGMAWALLATAAADTLLALLLAGRTPLRAERTTAAVAALLTGGPALLLGAWLAVAAQDPPAAARVAALLSTAAGVLLIAGRREKTFAVPLGCAAGVLLIAASGGLVRTLVPSDTWVVPGYLLCGVVLAGVVVERPSTPIRLRPVKQSPVAGILLAAGVMQGVAVLYGAPAVAQALLEPLGRAATPWRGAPHGAASATLLAGRPWTGDAGTPVLFAVPALALLAASRLRVPTAVRDLAAAGAVVLGGAAAVVTPLALGLPYAAVTAWLVVLVVGLLALSVVGLRRRHGAGGRAPTYPSVPGTETRHGAAAEGREAVRSLTATVAALVAGLTATGWALADRTATFVALTVLGTAFAAATRASLRRRATWPARDDSASDASGRSGREVPSGAGAAGREAGAGGGHGDSRRVAAAADHGPRTGGPASPVSGASGDDPSGRGGGEVPPAAGAADSGAETEAGIPGSAPGDSGRDGAGGTSSLAHAAISALCAVAAVLCAAWLARALPAALGISAEQSAFAVLALAAATAPLAGRLRTASPYAAETAHGDPAAGGPVHNAAGRPGAAASLAVECAGYAVAGWAVALSATSAPLLALVLGLCGVLAGGVALRGDRRPAGYVATALFLLATWVRLYASEVSVPEAYGLPLAVAAFAVGLLRARRSPGLSSWAAYGPALSCALLPSLVMVWGDSHWLRPLLLGAGSLAVTLLGARLRLQAPLLVGGAVLALVAGHELAPYVTQVIGMLPRWLPPALAGLLLLAVGATYEHRLRDARRLRAAWRRLG